MSYVVQLHRQAAGAQGSGVTGLKSLGVRELTYRLAFLASSVTTAGAKGKDPTLDDDVLEPVRACWLAAWQGGPGCR